ncbi:hypothetical protein CEXT_212011 [Caerostris extrusa]|uniref:Uncharacterized protein n=1 Tax=Caerostris extrusa TaxID=172846 RepID=A0AAV4QSM4_CAEEX|nr:hypothetical protein CEXT_212011 [Caerostris extrusa]
MDCLSNQCLFCSGSVGDHLDIRLLRCMSYYVQNQNLLGKPLPLFYYAGLFRPPFMVAKIFLASSPLNNIFFPLQSFKEIGLQVAQLGLQLKPYFEIKQGVTE